MGYGEVEIILSVCKISFQKILKLGKNFTKNVIVTKECGCGHPQDICTDIVIFEKTLTSLTNALPKYVPICLLIIVKIRLCAETNDI